MHAQRQCHSHIVCSHADAAQVYTDALDVSAVRRATVTSASQLPAHTHLSDGAIRTNPLFNQPAAAFDSLDCSDRKDDDDDDDDVGSSKLARMPTLTEDPPTRRASETSMNDYTSDFHFPPPPKDDLPKKDNDDDALKKIGDNDLNASNKPASEPGLRIEDAASDMDVLQDTRHASFIIGGLPQQDGLSFVRDGRIGPNCHSDKDYTEFASDDGSEHDNCTEAESEASNLYISAGSAASADSSDEVLEQHETLRQPREREKRMFHVSSATALAHPPDNYEEFFKV